MDKGKDMRRLKFIANPGKCFLLKTSAMSLCLGVVSPLHAQSNVESQQSAGTGEDDEIVVVAKRLQNVRDVPGIVNIVGSKQLTDVGAKDAEDIFKLTPGVQFNKGPADGSLLTIRGIGTSTSSDAASVGQLPTGIYIEDVPFTDPFQYVSTPDISAFDLESVKVLRGPQGALYGSGSLGGAISYTFKKPDLAGLGGSFLGTVASAQGGNAQASGYGAFNIPVVTDMLAVRVVGQYEKDPAYQDNIGTGQRNVNGRTVKGARALLLFKPVDNLTIDGLYMYQQSQQNDTSASYGPDVRYNNTPAPSSYKSHASLAKVEINYELGPVKLTSLTAHQNKERNLDGDLTQLIVPDTTVGLDVPAQFFYGFGPYPNVKQATNIERRSSNGTSQEFRVTSSGTHNLNWLVGVFGQDVKFKRLQNVYVVGANDPAVGDLFFNVDRDGKAKERAVFGEADLTIGDLKVGAGGRYFHTSVDFHQVSTASLLGTARVRDFSHSENGFTPKFQANYHIMHDVSVYAAAAKGFRFGGINTAPGATTYKSDNLWNYETGIRLRPTRAFNLDLSGFYIDWSDPQISSADQNGFVIVSNVSKAVSKGLEVSAQWHPVDRFNVSGSFTYTDAKTKAPFQSTRNFATDVAGGYTGNFTVPAGTKLPGTPDIQATLQPRYTISGPFGTDLTFSGVVNYNGKRRAQIDSDLMLGAYTTVDLRVEVVRDGWKAALAAQNIFNNNGISSGSYSYYTTGTGTDGFSQFYLIPPRVITLSIAKDF